MGRGDRVAALLPNGLEALVSVLAVGSFGAVWSSCSPDFGPSAIADRFTQIEPVVLLSVDGYAYGGKRFDVRAIGPPAPRNPAIRARDGARARISTSPRR